MSKWKKILPPIVILLAGSTTVFAVANLKPKPAPDDTAEGSPPKVKVNVAKAMHAPATLSVSSQGTVMPKRELDIVAQISGQVIAVEDAFENGGFFEKSQTLLKIDDSDYKALHLASKARLAEAKRRLAEEQGLSRQAKREWRDLGNERANALYLRKPQLAAAEAALQSAKAEVEKARLDLDRTEIRIPFNGRILNKHVDLGQFVTRGTPIARVYDPSIAEVRLALTDQQASLIDLPLFNKTQVNEGPRVTLEGNIAGKQIAWSGRITRIEPYIDINSRMLFAIAEFKTGDASPTNPPILPGLFVEAKIQGKILENIIALPRTALYKRDLIYSVNSDNKTIAHTASIVHKTSEQVWIEADINDGAYILTEKHDVTSPGTAVEPLYTQTSKSPDTDKTAAISAPQ